MINFLPNIFNYTDRNMAYTEIEISLHYHPRIHDDHYVSILAIENGGLIVVIVNNALLKHKESCQ